MTKRRIAVSFVEQRVRGTKGDGQCCFHVQEFHEDDSFTQIVVPLAQSWKEVALTYSTGNDMNSILECLAVACGCPEMGGTPDDFEIISMSGHEHLFDTKTAEVTVVLDKRAKYLGVDQAIQRALANIDPNIGVKFSEREIPDAPKLKYAEDLPITEVASYLRSHSGIPLYNALTVLIIAVDEEDMHYLQSANRTLMADSITLRRNEGIFLETIYLTDEPLLHIRGTTAIRCVISEAARDSALMTQEIMSSVASSLCCAADVLQVVTSTLIHYVEKNSKTDKGIPTTVFHSDIGCVETNGGQTLLGAISYCQQVDDERVARAREPWSPEAGIYAEPGPDTVTEVTKRAAANMRDIRPNRREIGE